MRGVLITLVTSAMLVGCGKSHAEQRTAYNASCEAHKAGRADAHAAVLAAHAAKAAYRLAERANAERAFAGTAAAAAADAAGTDRFNAATRAADDTAQSAWQEAQAAFGKPPLDPTLTPLWAKALEAARLAWETAERAKATHD